MTKLELALLTRIRLSTYFWVFFVIFLGLAFYIPGYKFDSGALTLFSVNSFLYGFYIAPILGTQKARIDALHQIVRAEANALFGMMLHIKKLPKRLRTDFQAQIVLYVHARLKHKSGEKQYEELISYCLKYEGEHQDKVEALLKDIIANQKNRTDFAMQTSNKVYANEWQIMIILFSITLGFILTLSIGDTPLLYVIKALLCTGLTMLVVILIKLNTLTHKRAKLMWQPFKKLLESHFYQID